MYVFTGNNTKSSLDSPVIQSLGTFLHRPLDAKRNVNLVGCSCLRMIPAEENPHMVHVRAAEVTTVPVLSGFSEWHVLQIA